MDENASLAPNQNEILALMALANQVERKLQQWLMANFGLSWPQYEILVAVLSLGLPTPTDVAAVIQCTRGNVTSVLDRLETGGFLRRQPDREDRRMVRLKVKNKAAVKEIQRAFNQYVGQLRATWSAAECSALQTTCEKLSSVL